jgi:hypothetical protein
MRAHGFSTSFFSLERKLESVEMSDDDRDKSSIATSPLHKVALYTVFILSPTRCDFDVVHDTVMFLK